jgi:hypothetical protein
MTTARVLLLGACVLAAACSSPEAARSRGSAAGADVGNRPAQVRMHEGSDPFWRTPHRIQREYPRLEGARQARELSRR